SGGVGDGVGSVGGMGSVEGMGSMGSAGSMGSVGSMGLIKRLGVRFGTPHTSHTPHTAHTFAALPLSHSPTPPLSHSGRYSAAGAEAGIGRAADRVRAEWSIQARAPAL